MSKKTCFIIMPISVPPDLEGEYLDGKEHFVHVLDTLFVPAVEQIGFEPIRPIMKGGDLIHAEIVKNLIRADLVLCDMSARNPNAFFEAGIRTALNKPIGYVRDEKPMHVPFDTTILNHHTYSSKLHGWELKQQMAQVAGYLTDVIVRSEGQNPMWQNFGVHLHAEKPKAGGIEEQVALLSKQVEAMSEKMPRGVFEPRSIFNLPVPPLNAVPITSERAAYTPIDIAPIELKLLQKGLRVKVVGNHGIPHVTFLETVTEDKLEKLRSIMDRYFTGMRFEVSAELG